MRVGTPEAAHLAEAALSPGCRFGSGVSSRSSRFGVAHDASSLCTDRKPHRRVAHDWQARLYVRQEIYEAFDLGADNENREGAAGPVLLVLQALVHCDEEFKTGRLGD